jgi:putative DNA primase/helicase
MNDTKLLRLKYYCEHGWPIFPLHWLKEGLCSCGSANCKSPGKHPLVAGGFKSASVNIAQVQAWHTQWPHANWGMRTGDAQTGGAGILVIDIDAKSDGYKTWELLRDENLGSIETITVETGGGGMHLWFIYPSALEIRSGAGTLGQGIDIRANNGYVLIPPSRTDRDYRFLLNPTDTSLEPCPEWILTRVNGRVTTHPLPAGIRIGMEIPQGVRHQSLITMAGSMKRVGMTPEEIFSSLKTLREKRFESGDHDVTDNEIDAAVSWISNKDRSYALTDLGNAERFVDLFGYWVKYSYEWEEWLVWDGRRWAINAEAEVMMLAHATVRSIYSEAARAMSLDERRAITKHAIASEAQSKVENMLNSAKPYLAIRADQLDQNPMFLNVLNGMIDLGTGTLLAHDPNLLITRLINVNYEPHAKFTEWEKFLNLVTGGDQDLQSFLQLAVGYSLTGRTDEHCLFVLYGTGSNGKTTFTETLRLLLGDYAKRVNVETLMQSWGSTQAATPEIANMAGARFVLSSEIPENRKLNESLVKDLTGGDAITARKLFANPFTYTPSHKLWIFGNHKPRITGTDEGIWRRIQVVPFSVTIPKEKRRKMSDVLQVYQGERQGILAWAVAGCVLWQVGGLTTPDTVQAATEEYRNEQDLVQQFLDENCEMHVDYSVDKDELYKSWKDWCEAAGEQESAKRSKKWLTHQMTDRGFRQGGAQKRTLFGIQVKK